MNLRCLAWFGLFGLLAGLSACGGGSSYRNNPPPPPGGNPSISTISPMSATAGGAGFTLTVNGSNFSSGATVGWLNPDNPGTFGRTATFVSTTQLTAQISAADIAMPSSSVEVSVVVPVLGSTPSNKVTFTINSGPPGGAHVISPGANGATPNGGSLKPSLSFNGRFVSFSSEATNLVVPNTKFPEGYVRDTCLGADPGTSPCTPSTLLVSAITGGSVSNPAEGNALGGAEAIGAQGFTPPASGIPPYGRFIGFLSSATNLVTPNTQFFQAYVRDSCVGAATPTGCTPLTMLASVTQNGSEPNGQTGGFAFASNTCNAAFVSAGTNVLSGVTTPNEVYLASCSANGLSGGFNTPTLVSASSSGVPGDQGATQPAISADGRFVAFASNSTNLPGSPGGGVNMQSVYVRDACTLAPAGCTPSTVLVSADGSGNALTGISQLPAISNDGRFVVFTTLVPPPPPGGGLIGMILIRDTCNSSTGPVMGCTPSTTTISEAVGGGAANGPSNSRPHAVSGDGRFVVFDSSATNLVIPATTGNQVFVRDTCKSSSGSVSDCAPHTVLISIDSTGKPIGGLNAAISDDGHFAAFENETTIFQIMLAATGF
jgi:trimeric autotransporter adhesin